MQIFVPIGLLLNMASLIMTVKGSKIKSFVLRALLFSGNVLGFIKLFMGFIGYVLYIVIYYMQIVFMWLFSFVIVFYTKNNGGLYSNFRLR